jgi:uncharacterized protein (DUF2235 family)
MARSLVLCIDGTWNRGDDPGAPLTNVARISRLLRDVERRQRVLYLPGVGTEKGLDRFVGGFWGGGTARKILEGYRYLCQNYEEGDCVSLFGFSRGAFAVRAIMGLIANVGVVGSKHLEEAILLYQLPLNRFRRLDKIQELKRRTSSYPIQIRFVGVWDTVIRHGPILGIARQLVTSMSGRSFGLFDQYIPWTVQHFCHALALDETRAVFSPWRALSQDGTSGQEVKEVWFAGSHSDVGGGNPDTSLPDVSLSWMVQEAMNAGLEFYQVPAAATDAACSSITYMNREVWRYLKPLMRTVAADDRLHASVYERARRLNYRPAASLPRGMDLRSEPANYVTDQF